MSVLVFGKNGRAGWELQGSLAPVGDVIVLDRSGAKGLGGDLTGLEGMRRTLATVSPEVVVNAVAYTAVHRRSRRSP